MRLPGLIAWLSPIQPISVPRLLGRMPAPSERREPDVRQVGPGEPLAAVPAMRWQAAQPARSEQPRAAPHLGVDGGRGGAGARARVEPALRIAPARARRRRSPSARAAPPQILGALPAIDAGACRPGSRSRLRAPRDHVELARQARHPEAVDHVVGFQLEHHRPAGRNVQLVGVGMNGAALPRRDRRPATTTSRR